MTTDSAQIPPLGGEALKRKQAQQALRDRESESRSIVDTIPGLVAILTPAGEVDVVNDQVVEYCGQPLEAMKQWGTNGTVHAEDLPHVGQRYGLLRNSATTSRWSRMRRRTIRTMRCTPRSTST